MHIDIQLHDIKEIVNKSLQGGGSVNYTPLEIALAKKCLVYYNTIARKADETDKLFAQIYSIYTTVTGGELGEDLKAKRKKDLAVTSKAYFAKAVELDSKLKGIIDDDTNQDRG